VLLWAREYGGYYAARLEFAAQRVLKEYVCLCRGLPTPGLRLLGAPLMAKEQHAWRGKAVFSRSFATAEAQGGRQARTEVREAGHLLSPEGGSVGLLRVRLHTGRRHQIRAHLSNEGHPLAGDGAYGGSGLAWCRRTFLHACRLRLDVGYGPIDAVSALPDELRNSLRVLVPVDDRARALARTWAQG